MTAQKGRDPLLDGKFPDGGATAMLVRELEKRVGGTQAHKCWAERQLPHFYHAAQYCGAVPVKKEIEKLQRAKNLAPAIRDRHIQALEQGRILR